MDFTEETATPAVVGSFANTQDPRLREILEKLVPHLHAFVRETRLTLPGAPQMLLQLGVAHTTQATARRPAGEVTEPAVAERLPETP